MGVQFYIYSIILTLFPTISLDNRGSTVITYGILLTFTEKLKKFRLYLARLFWVGNKSHILHLVF